MIDRPPILGQKAFSGAFAGAFNSPFSTKGGFNAKAQGTLVLDLDATVFSSLTFNGGDISGWADQSGADNNAAQATATAQPTYNATGINNRPSLTFPNSAIEHMVITDPVTLRLASSFTAYIVCNPDGFSQFPTMFSKSSNNNYRFLFSSDGKLRCILNGLPGPSLSDQQSSTNSPTGPAVVEINYQVTVGGAIKFSVNGAALGADKTSDRSSITTSTADFVVGRTPSAGSQNFKGEYGRLLIYSNLLPLENRNNVITGLGDQFGITVGTVT